MMSLFWFVYLILNLKYKASVKLSNFTRQTIYKAELELDRIISIICDLFVIDIHVKVFFEQHKPKNKIKKKYGCSISGPQAHFNYILTRKIECKKE